VGLTVAAVIVMSTMRAGQHSLRDRDDIMYAKRLVANLKAFPPRTRVTILAVGYRWPRVEAIVGEGGVIRAVVGSLKKQLMVFPLETRVRIVASSAVETRAS
jgi:butyrate kinase